ncbi:MAG: MarR family winged helix-turn-helix transcriptional regulator [Actinomycetia bacterium]|nr:MarR family winged helix-turn-helix transcriptional regulator [Actinomycetes bacterium]
MTPFGPQLIGETEKTLNAILRGVLAETGLTEPQWVTLRIAARHDGDAPLAAVVAERAQFTDAPALVAALVDRGLLDGERVSESGSQLLARLGAHLEELTAPIWADLSNDDVAATERVLNLVVDRARSILSYEPIASSSSGAVAGGN